jgi:long-chain acyl-CoA synthetase
MSAAMTRQEAIAALTAPGEPYETALVDGLRCPEKVFVHAPATLGALFAATLSDLPFIVYEDEHWTFREAHQHAASIAHLLVHDIGVRPGDRVAISMRNYPEWMLAFCAITAVGGIAVAMNSLWTAEEMEWGLLDCGASVLFADRERIDLVAHCASLAGLRVVAVRTEAPASGVDLAAAVERIGAVPMPDVAVDADDAAIILYTSGSTGRPKGVVSTHRNIISALMMWELDVRQQLLRATAAGRVVPPATQQPTTLLAVPLFHVLGLHVVFLSSFRAQRKIVCMYRWDTARAVELIEREQVTAFSGPPAMTGDLVREAQRTNRDLSSLVSVGGGGASRAPEQVRQIDASFRNATPGTGWGMTETNAVGTVISGVEYLDRPMSAGRCLALLELRVVDDVGEPLPCGERGELQIRGTSMFVEYWNRPDATADSFVAGGWFRTGDVAYLDDDDHLFIVDRIKDLIIRGGENIGCGQVEAALLAYPDVFEAAVYSVPDDRLGEEVAATLHGAPTLDLDALRAFLQEHLARYEVPRYLFVSPQPLPRTGSGKVFKRELREEAVAAMTGARTAVEG